MTMNDEQIDNMIRISLKREETLETIGRNVMTDIRRRSRRRRVMAIARLIAAAFGLPALAVAAVVCILALYRAGGNGSAESIALTALMLGIVTAAYGSIIVHFKIRNL